MPFKCCVVNCKGNYDSAENNVHVFGFPKDETLKRAWERAIPRKGFVYTKHSKVCEKHFMSKDIERESSGFDEKCGKKIVVPLTRPRLKPGAIPSLFPDCPSYLNNLKSSRDSPSRKRVKLEQDQIIKSISLSQQSKETILRIGHFKTVSKQILYKNFQGLGAAVEWVDATQMIEEMRVDVQNVLSWKRFAVERIADVAEHAAAGHQHDKNIKYEYFNARVSDKVKDDNVVVVDDDDDVSNIIVANLKPKKSIRELDMKPHKNFANAPVNFKHSSVHVPSNVYDKDAKVLNAIKWSDYLTPAFRNNLAVDPSLNWQYFGSSTGFLRTFPATTWAREGREKPDLYDCRTRSWYVKAAASAKDIVVLVDGSGSMTGIRKEIARNVVADILATLTEDDYVTILRFSDDVSPVVPCFENSLVQANEENTREFMRHMKKIKTENIANFTLSLITAFELLQKYNRSGLGTQCNQAIMIITDGAPNTFDDIFRRYNYPNIPVRVFTYLIGKEVTESHEVTWMACQNKGYYTHMATLPEVRDKVQKYVPVMSRPVVLSGTRPFVWTSVYADVPATDLTLAEWKDREFEQVRRKLNVMRRDIWFALQEDDEPDDPDSTPEPLRGMKEIRIPRTRYKMKQPLQLMTTVATPVFDKRNIKAATLVGVAGTDVPIREITKLTKAYKIGVNAYSFAITNNGHVLYHPDLRPLYQDLLKPGYRNVELTEVELVDTNLGLYEFEETLLTIRKNMVDRRIGWGKMSVKIPSESFKRVVTRNNSYYYGPIDDTPFSLAVSLPEPYGHYRVIGQVEVKRREEDWLQYFQGQNWRVHPNWVYCENPQKEDDGYTTPEESIRIFLSDSLSTQNFRWRTSSTRPPIFDKPICEKDLIQSLVFDAKATSVDYKKCFEKNNIKYDEEKFVKMFGLTVTFVATRSGLLRFVDHWPDTGANGTEKPIFQAHTKATEEEFYRRAVDFYNVNSSAFVFSVPYDAGNRKGSFVTGSHAIFLGTGKKRAPAAVVGLQFHHSAFADRFFETTTKCMQACRYKCRDDALDCFLLDNNGFIIVSEKHEHTGKFFGEIDYTLFDSMIEIGIYKRVHVYDYQAICLEIDPSYGFAPFLLTPFHHLRNLLNWMWSKLALLYIQFSLYEWWSKEWVMASSEFDDEDNGSDRPNKTVPHPCEKELDLYEMLPRDFSEPVKGRLSMCHSSGCDKQFIVQQVPYTNLVMLVVYTVCPCETTSVKLEAKEVHQNETLRCQRMKQNIYRRRPKVCLNYHPEEADMNHECGGSSHITSLSISNLLLGLAIFYCTQRCFHV